MGPVNSAQDPLEKPPQPQKRASNKKNKNNADANINNQYPNGYLILVPNGNLPKISCLIY